ncbi:MAG: hypothetical protein HKP12_03845 [Gammaproteobacteria bacterium]|nr:hypothetical protein [Gammaproteobacteria bacterium]
MIVIPGTAYAQARIQSRYGRRADAGVWLKLHKIHDLSSYLQTAQQMPLRHWVLGLGTNHSSHQIELTLRQKYRSHVDEVAGWMPTDWRKSLQWVKRLVDLPVLQYLVDGGEPLTWIRSDPDISNFIADDPTQCLQAIRRAGNGVMVDKWQQSGSILTGWLTQWNALRPESSLQNQGIARLQRLLLERKLHAQMQLQSKHQEAMSPTEYEIINERLRLVYRRYAFLPAAVFAYLAMVALDIHRLRNDLMQRLYFQQSQEVALRMPQ